MNKIEAVWNFSVTSKQ